jgi:hypothetical protein
MLIFANNSIVRSMSDNPQGQADCRTVAGAVPSVCLPLKIPFIHARHLIELPIAKDPRPNLMRLSIHSKRGTPQHRAMPLDGGFARSFRRSVDGKTCLPHIGPTVGNKTAIASQRNR